MFAGVSFADVDFGNCVGMWLFDEGRGNTVEDSSGTGNDGKLEGGAKWVDGKFDKGVQS